MAEKLLPVAFGKRLVTGALCQRPPFNDAGENHETNQVSLSWSCRVRGQVVPKTWACCNATQVPNAVSVWWLRELHVSLVPMGG